MSNEELAVLIQRGDQGKCPELWAQVERFVSMKAGRTARTLDGYGGVTAEDLYQAGYFALLAAVEAFDPDKGYKFTSYLGISLKTAFAEAAGYRSKKRDTLNYAVDLDSPVPGTDDLILADSVSDPAAGLGFEDVERRVWLEQLRATLDKAMEDLTPLERETVEAHHYQGKPLREIAEESGVSIERVRQRESKAFRTLRQNKRRNHLEEFVEQRTPYYLHVGVSRFNSTGSSAVEEIALIRDRARERFV